MPPRAAFRPLLAVAAALALWLALGGQPAHANRFGPPWQAQVVVDQSVVYSQPDRAAPPVGPLSRGAIVVVLGEVKDAQGGEWTAIADGFVPSSDVVEKTDFWIGEVAVPSVSVYAKPNAQGEIRRTARQGDLLRVAGMSPGLDGDTGIWWATTEGYVRLGGLRGATSEWAAGWQLPTAEDATRGWWGTVRGSANVRAGASTEAPIVGQFAGGERVKVLAEEQGEPVSGNPTWYRIDGGRYAGARVHASLVARQPDPRPSTAPPPPEAPPGPYIVIDKGASTLTYVQDGQARFTTYVALGRAGVETPTGFYSTLGKYRADDMTSTSVSDADRSYDLPNVPFTQYYRLGGYAIHGTYWHDRFGTLESQGCVNLTHADAAFLFPLTQPTVEPDVNARWTAAENATPVVIVG